MRYRIENVEYGMWNRGSRVEINLERKKRIRF